MLIHSSNFHAKIPASNESDYNHEPAPAIFPSNLSAAVGRVDGGRFATVDGALSVRLREVDLGHGWHPLEGDRQPTHIPALSAVR